MKLKLVLHGNTPHDDPPPGEVPHGEVLSGGAQTRDVVVTADATATVEDVARALAAEAADTPATLTLVPADPSGQAVMLDPSGRIGDAPLGSGFDVAVAVATPSAYLGGEAAAVVTVLSGQDAGRTIPLARGATTIGRTAAAEVRLNDAMVSRRHARVEVSEYGIEVIDLNSANGIATDGRTLQRAWVIPGQTITLGRTELSFELLPSARSSASPADADPRPRARGGVILFNRSPRVEMRAEPREHQFPAVPDEAEPQAFPWPMVLAPILLGIGMFVMSGRAESLWVVLMSPLMALGSFAGQRILQRRKRRGEMDAFERELAEVEQDLADESAAERSRRKAEAPAASTVLAESLRLSPLLWTRRPEHQNFLSLRLGTGRAHSRIDIPAPQEGHGQAAYADRIAALLERFATIDGVPLVESLSECGALGLAGPRPLAADAVRGLAVQLFGLHAPSDVVAAAIVGPGWADEFGWMKWLPHVTSAHSPCAEVALADTQTSGEALLAALEEEILRRTRDGAGAPRVESPKVVVWVTDDAPVDRARLGQVIERGPNAGIHVVFVGPTVASLPAACRSYLDLSGGLDGAEVGWVRAGRIASGVRVEAVSTADAERFAKRLAPLVDASAVAPDASDLPRSVPLLGLLGRELGDDAGAVIERWRQNRSIIDRADSAGTAASRTSEPRRQLDVPQGLRAYVGQSSPDALTLDLRAQGPHALVGGTTGSGKSEFLQAWVLGLAAEHSPDRVTFLFVDYKGGAAFAGCAGLPHRVGTVTDLTPHLARRALTSLRAEVRRRERLLDRRGAKDLLELERRQDPETPPALVIVIDEFATLVAEVPEFVDGVVDVAQRGRSLGIHLILATQRPAGVITENLRANTNLRVALRVADESDSRDVVGSAVAASFDPSVPGRGVVKSGPGRLIPFQSAYAGGRSGRGAERASVTVADLRFGGAVAWEDHGAESHRARFEQDPGLTDQERLVHTLSAAARAAGIPTPRRPWLDVLPAAIDLRDLLQDPTAAARPAPEGAAARIPFGVADIPERQAQEPVYFAPDTDGHLLIYGTSGSGKSAALRTLGIAAGARPELGATAVYGLDCGAGALRSIEVMPHVGSVISGDDVERARRLFRMLGRELDERGSRFSEAGAATLTEYRALTGDLATPRILLLIDGFGAFRQEWEASPGRSAHYAVLLRLITEGRPLGLHVVASAERFGAVPTAVSAGVPKRVVLRMSDDGAYAMLGAPRGVLDEGSGPGRAVVAGSETQIATPGGTVNAAEQLAATRKYAARLREQGAPEAPPIGSLPTELTIEALPAEVGGLPTLGVTEETLGPRGFEPEGVFLVAGPPQSGKSTALRSIVSALERWGPGVELVHLGGRRSALAGFRSWSRAAATIADVRDLTRELTAEVANEARATRLAIVLEGITEYADTDAERPLRELLRAVQRSRHFLVADGDAVELSSGYGLIGELKACRRGIALRPDTADGESLFRLPFPRVQRHEFPPGRGLLVEHGRAETVQIPLAKVQMPLTTAQLPNARERQSHPTYEASGEIAA